MFFRKKRQADNICKAGFVDVETTGLKPPEDEIIELAIVLVSYNPDNGELLKLLQKYTGFREPATLISRKATKVHGLTFKDVKGKKLDRRAISKIITNADLVVAHNTKFDYQFLICYMQEFENKPWYCSMEQLSWPGGARALEKIAEAFGLAGAVKHHRAIDDVAIMVDLLNRKDEEGQRYFKRLLDAGPLPEDRFIPFKPIRI